MTRPRSRQAAQPARARFTEADFETADTLDAVLGITALGDVRRRELINVVHHLAEADRVVAEVRASMLGPYGGLLRLTLLNRRVTRAVARIAALDRQLDQRLDEACTSAAGRRAAAVLRDRMRLHLEVEAELVARLSPERKAVVDSLRSRG